MLYALNPKAVTHYPFKDEKEKKNFCFVLPERINNPRLIAQSGLLLHMNIEKGDLESIISEYNEERDQFSLLKISIPDEIRKFVLRDLNAMNINHRTLFPENAGAGEHANMALEISGYDPILHVVKDLK